jgi:hypothetical protein
MHHLKMMSYQITKKYQSFYYIPYIFPDKNRVPKSPLRPYTYTTGLQKGRFIGKEDVHIQ